MARPLPTPDAHLPRPTSPRPHRTRPEVSYPPHLSSPTSSRRSSRSRNRSQFLDSCKLSDSELIICPGDTVFVRPRDPADKSYVARIEQIERGVSQASHIIHLCWYYRPEETHVGRQPFHGTKELFLSDHRDSQSIDTIEGKCNIHTIEDYSKLNSVDAADFFCRFEYKPSTGTYLPESTDLYVNCRFCKCKQQYNPDEFMVLCESCLNWFHPACIGLSTEMVELQAKFFCEDCKVSLHSENQKSCEDLSKGGAMLSEEEQDHLKSSEDSRKRAAVEDLNNHSTNGMIKDLFVKHDKLWSEKMETSNKNVIAAVQSLLDENATNLQEFHKKITQDLIAGINLILSPKDREHEIAGVLTTSDQTIDPHEAPNEKCSLVALIYDDRMRDHKPPEGSVGVHEMPERLSCIMKKLTDDGLADRCTVFGSVPAPVDSLTEVHDVSHVKFVDSISSKIEKAVEDGDMFYSAGTSTAALLAAGSVIKACDLVVSEGFKSSFAIVRPPGHHVGKKGPPIGFCLLNNICVGAAHLLKHHKMERILILDFDIHHGDGTEEIFREDKRVLVFSIHRNDSGFYPNKRSGNLSNVGRGAGIGYNINVCWQHHGINDADYEAVWDHLLLPVVHEFNPEAILISAGFDAADGDKLGLCKVTPRGYANMVEKLTSYPIVMALEGGYDLDSIAASAAACVQVLLGDKIFGRDGSLPFDTTYKMIEKTRKKHMPYWRCYEDEIPETIRSRCICKE